MKSSKLKLASIILAVVLCLLVLSAPAGAVVQPNSDFYVWITKTCFRQKQKDTSLTAI